MGIATPPTDQGPRSVLEGLSNRARMFIVIDVENHNGGPDASTYARVARFWDRLIPDSPTNLRVCGSDVSGALAAHRAFPHARVVCGTGPDGADRALLKVLDEDHVTRRFEIVVIGSGDHAFTAAAQRLRTTGLYVVAVAIRAMAGDLRDAVDQALVFPAGELEAA